MQLFVTEDGSYAHGTQNLYNHQENGDHPACIEQVVKKSTATSSALFQQIVAAPGAQWQPPLGNLSLTSCHVLDETVPSSLVHTITEPQTEKCA